MMKRLVFALTAVAALATAPAVAADPKVFKSRSCTAGTACFVTFDWRSDLSTPTTVITINAKSAGKAVVTMTGSMQCVYSSSQQGDVGVVDLSGTMVKNPSAPAPFGEGVVRFAMRMPPPPGPSTPGLSLPINLAATQIFDVSKGKTDIYHWLVKNRMDANTSCKVFDVGMSAIFIP